MSGINDARLSSHAAMKPQNVEQIVRAAKEYEYNAQVPVRYWLRTAAALLKEADIYMREGDDETTYLLLFRHAHLVLAHLEAHLDARDKSTKALLAQARREVDRNLKVLDALKPRINQRYERYTSIMRDREQRRVTQSRTSIDESGPEDNTRQADKRRVQHLHGHENSDLAVRLAQQEYQRRAIAHESSARPTSRRNDDGNDLSHRLQAIRSRVDVGTKEENDSFYADKGRDNTTTGYSYPSVKARQAHQTPDYTSQPYSRQSSIPGQPAAVPPSLPPKPVGVNQISVPPRPGKIRSLQNFDSAASIASSDTTYTFAATAFLENGNPLRTLFLPPTLRTTFLRIAHKNTKANLETCGFLAGTLISNALFVSKLIIPAQISTSDTCEMTNESQLFDYVDSGADLMILGWIHTHPTQTCFMSSRDLHTHAGYQMMLPESVAIVCAPSKGDTTHGGDWGVYRLTDPPGKMAILNCNKPGVFHPHEVENIWTDALRPGHVVEAQGLAFEVVDLRDL